MSGCKLLTAFFVMIHYLVYIICNFNTMSNHSPISTHHSLTKWGIIGCGRIAHRFMQGLNALPGNVLAAAYSRRVETVDAFVAEYGGVACSRAEEL